MPWNFVFSEVVEQVVHDRLRDVRDGASIAPSMSPPMVVPAGRLLAPVCRLEERPTPKFVPVPHALRARTRACAFWRTIRAELRRAGASSPSLRAHFEGVVDQDHRERRVESFAAASAAACCVSFEYLDGMKERAEDLLRLRPSPAPARSAERSICDAYTGEQRVSTAESATPMVLNTPVFSVVAHAERERVEEVLAEVLARRRLLRLAGEEEAAVCQGSGR